MGSVCSYVHSYYYRHFSILVFFLFVSASIKLQFIAEGRAIYQLVEVGKIEDASADTEKIGLKAQIGSRPPRCGMKCSSCGHCEAVQVPAVPQNTSGRRHVVVSTNSKGEDNSNYKPMNWKCKCGDLIFNP